MPAKSKLAHAQRSCAPSDTDLILEGLMEALARVDADARLDGLLVAYADKLEKHANAQINLAQSIMSICLTRSKHRSEFARPAIINGYNASERTFAGRPKMRKTA